MDGKLRKKILDRKKDGTLRELTKNQLNSSRKVAGGMRKRRTRKKRYRYKI